MGRNPVKHAAVIEETVVTQKDFAAKDNTFSGVQSRVGVPMSRSEKEMASLAKRHLSNWPGPKTYPRYRP